MAHKKGYKNTPKATAAGQANLQKWLDAHPERGFLRHGAGSVYVKGRYNNKRFKEGSRWPGLWKH